MIFATHVIFSAYGFWLPNDPRGSWSDFVASWELLKYGKATKVSTHRSVARVQHDVRSRLAAKTALLHPPAIFNGVQALTIAKGFSTAISEASYCLHACCILPDHVHLVVARHARDPRQIVGHLKAASTRELHEKGFHPDFSPWSRGCWRVFLDSPADVRRAIRYVEDNPLKEGKRKQVWSFVRPYVEEIF